MKPNLVYMYHTHSGYWIASFGKNPCVLYSNFYSTYYPHMPIGMVDIYIVYCLFACLQMFCNRYLRRGLMQGNEIW